MDTDKQDIDEQIDHHQKMLQILRRRLRVQERKEAEFGISVPTEVATEIMSLNERIAKHEAELARLKSVAAEGEVPLAEVEYRAALAQVWEPGRPTVAGAAQLEWVRVRSGIKPERAEQLEGEIRRALAFEAVESVPSRLMQTRYELHLRHSVEDETVHHHYSVPLVLMKSFGSASPFQRALRLDTSAVTSTIAKKFGRSPLRCMSTPSGRISSARYQNIVTDDDDVPLFTDPIEAFSWWLQGKVQSDNNIDELWENDNYLVYEGFAAIVTEALKHNTANRKRLIEQAAKSAEEDES